MAYDRDYPDSWNRDDDFARNYRTGPGSGRSSARDYEAAGQYDREDRNFRGGGTGYGERDYRPAGGGERQGVWGRETHGGNRDYYGGRDFDRGSYGANTAGSYGAEGQRFAQTGGRQPGYGNRDWDRERGQAPNRGYGRQPQGYDYEDRGFIARAGDEVRSWFGDEDAERRREFDQRYDERQGYSADTARATAHGRDGDYHNWRRGQIDALDRDYHEYRQENAKKFESEFGTWRSNRQTQRASLSSVKEHMEVVGSDGGHVGTVDKVRGDRIVLTKTDADAGGRHHSIPSSWLQSVDDKVTIAQSADEAKAHWRDEEQSGALFGDRDHTDRTGDRDEGKVDLNRSFSGTY